MTENAIISDTTSIKKIKNLSLLVIIEKLSHYLPDQPPLEFFVHHNTLHSYAHMNFKDAAIEASTVNSAEAFMSEYFYFKALQSHRIQQDDIIYSINKYIENSKVSVHLPSKHDLLKWFMTHDLNIPDSATIDWWLEEKQLLIHPHPLVQTTLAKLKPTQIKKLWNLLLQIAPNTEKKQSKSLQHFYLQKSCDLQSL